MEHPFWACCIRHQSQDIWKQTNQILNNSMKYDYTIDYGPTGGNDQATTEPDEITEMNIEVQQLILS